MLTWKLDAADGGKVYRLHWKGQATPFLVQAFRGRWLVTEETGGHGKFWLAARHTFSTAKAIAERAHNRPCYRAA